VRREDRVMGISRPTAITCSNMKAHSPGRADPPGQIDVPWTDAIKADFFKWLESRPSKPPIPRDLIDKHL